MPRTKKAVRESGDGDEDKQKPGRSPPPDKNVLSKIETMLEQLKIDENLSKTKLKAKVGTMGICLRNGKVYGNSLPEKLQAKKGLIVSSCYVKKSQNFPLVKFCLVDVFGD